MKAGYRIGYRRVGMEYPMHSDCYQFFVHPFSSFFQQSHTLNKMQYLADTDVFIVTCFHKMMSQVPKSQCGQSLTVTNNMWSHFRCLFTYAHWGLFTSISLNGCLLKWQCPDSKPVSILSWFLLRLNNSPVFCTGFLKKSFSTHTIWILFCSGSFMRDWQPSQNNLEFIWKLSRALMTAWLGKNIDVPTCIVLSYMFHSTGVNGIFSLEYCVVKPKTEAAPTCQAPSIHLSP